MRRLLATAALIVLCGGHFILGSAAFGQKHEKDAPKKKDRERNEPEKKEPRRPIPGFELEFDFPKFDELFKGAPLDPKQREQLREQFERAREQWRKAIERNRDEMKKRGAFPGGPFPGGARPGLPGQGLFPMPLPGDGFPGIPGLPGLPGFPPGGFDRPGAGRLGVAVDVPAAILVEQLGLKENEGLVVADVRPDSAAAKAGIKANDILLEWAGKPVVSDPAKFKELVDAAKEAVDVKVLRKGKSQMLKGVTLPERKTAPVRPRPRLDVRAPDLASPAAIRA